MLTSYTAHINLASCAGYDYFPYYFDPILYWIILTVDATKMAPRYYILCAYLGLAILRTLLYIIFMRSISYQICEHM